MAEVRASEGLRISDLGGLVFGYSLAALLARAFLPSAPRQRGELVFLGSTCLIYVWLGLAMSGPVILTFDRWRRNAPGPDGKPVAVRHTRAELCWLLIGGYWLIMTACLTAQRMPGMIWPFFFLMPAIGAVAFAIGSFFRAPRKVTPSRAWTHWAAVTLLATWPIAWGLLIMISWSL